MNEEDVKQSILDKLKKSGKNSNEFSLDYIYICSLVTCDDKEKISLDEEENKILESYGNNFQAFYEIKKIKGAYIKENIKDDFEMYFDSINLKNFELRLNDYYNNEKNDKILADNLYYLVKCTKQEIPIKDFLSYSHLIPFRFFIFKYKDNNFFKMSEINIDESITLQYQCSKYLYYLSIMYQNVKSNLSQNISSKANDPNYKALDFEESFKNFLYMSDNFINKVKIIDKICVQNFFNIKESDFNLESLQNNQALVFSPIHQNALGFDCGILRCINKEEKIFYLYLFQVTRKKNAEERMSYLTINDYLSYLKLYYNEVLGININELFFAYVFDFNSQDTASISFCNENKLDFLLFNERTQLVMNKFKLNPYKPKIKFLNFKEKKEQDNNNIPTYMEIEKITSGDIKDSFKYLSRKRNIITKINKKLNEEKKKNKKRFDTVPNNTISNNEKSKGINLNEEDDEDKENIDLFEDINKNIDNILKKFTIVKDYLSKIQHNHNNIEIDYLQREKIIQDYLLGISQKDFPGISYSIQDQKRHIQFLEKIFTKNEIEKLFRCIFNDEKDFIIKIEKIKKNFISPEILPEYKTYIIAKFKGKGYYLNYITSQHISLSDNENISFDYYLTNVELYAIYFVTTKSKNEYINNLINNTQK